MDAINRPRSITKAVAITAITLTVAAFATALGIGLRAVLWEIKNATAEMNKAAAAMEQAKSTVVAAVEQAKGAVAAAERQAVGTIQAASLQANAAIQAAYLRNISDIEITKKGTGPALLNPMEAHTRLTDRIALLKNEMKTGREIDTERSLSGQELATRERDLKSAERKRDVVRESAADNISGFFQTAMQGTMDAIKKLGPLLKPAPYR